MWRRTWLGGGPHGSDGMDSFARAAVVKAWTTSLSRAPLSPCAADCGTYDTRTKSALRRDRLRRTHARKCQDAKITILRHLWLVPPPGLEDEVSEERCQKYQIKKRSEVFGSPRELNVEKFKETGAGDTEKKDEEKQDE